MQKVTIDMDMIGMVMIETGSTKMDMTSEVMIKMDEMHGEK
jgi:hypothetical protein